MSEERKPLPETGFRCYAAKPEKITCNMTVIMIDQMISMVRGGASKRSTNIKKDGQRSSTPSRPDHG